MHVHVWRFPLWHLKCCLTFSTKHLWCKTSVSLNYESARLRCEHENIVYSLYKSRAHAIDLHVAQTTVHARLQLRHQQTTEYHDPMKTG